MQINWTFVTYLVIGLFALSGFFRGWWKEGITSIFLIFLVFLLQQPGVAETFINAINSVLVLLWNLAPNFFSLIFNDLLGLGTPGSTAAIQADPGQASTWLTALVVIVLLAILLGRFLVPGSGSVTIVGSILGGLIGAFNGFIVVNLVREYLDGRALPGSVTPATEITLAGASTAGIASPGLTVQAVELPRFTILDSLVPWIVIAVGLLILVAVIRTGFGFRGASLNRRVPPGYNK